MLFLRFLAVLALAIWIGGLVTLGGVAASTVFEVLETHDPAGGRQLAGVVFGAVFGRFGHVTVVAGGVLLLSLGLRAALGPRPRRFGVRMWVAAAMLAGALTGVLLISPRIEGLRSSVTGPVANLPDQDPRKIEFGRWHALSTGLMLLTVVAGAGLIWTEVNDRH